MLGIDGRVVKRTLHLNRVYLYKIRKLVWQVMLT